MNRTVIDTWQLIPKQAERSRAAFSNDGEYEQFRRDFAESVRNDLEKHLYARQKSEEAARQHRVN